ncbi:MAG: hypothetical protein IJ545_04870 [Alphaproteobacteria bacterium]|nr:hypothetical protein [Alphaproteobacteria bacterium]
MLTDFETQLLFKLNDANNDAHNFWIENKKLKEQLAEHKDMCCCATNEVITLENTALKEENEKLKNTLRGCKFTCLRILNGDVFDRDREIKEQLAAIRSVLNEQRIETKGEENAKIKTA